MVPSSILLPDPLLGPVVWRPVVRPLADQGRHTKICAVPEPVLRAEDILDVERRGRDQRAARYLQHPTGPYGRRKTTALLRRFGLTVVHHTDDRLIRDFGLNGVRRRIRSRDEPDLLPGSGRQVPALVENAQLKAFMSPGGLALRW